MPALPPPLIVTNPHQLKLLAAELAAAGRLALDTESNSLYVYHHQVCLIQLSTDDHDVIIDPLAFDDLSPLGEVLAREDIEVTIHAAENDILLLHRDFGWTFGRVFDTLWAARILGWPRPGLASILKEHFGVVLNKRMQRTDWGKRPLSPAQLDYARLDTHYLLPLRDHLEQALRDAGRWEEAQEVFSELRGIRWEEKPEPTMWRLSGVHHLEPEQQAVLHALFQWREQRARQRNLPPYRVLSNQTLMALAQELPQTEAELRAIPGMPRHLPDYLARKLLRVIQKGRRARPPVPPRASSGSRPDAATQARYEALRHWRTQKAAERGVEPDVILTNSKLMAIARANPASLEALAQLELLGPWRLQTYGPEILRVLSH